MAPPFPNENSLNALSPFSLLKSLLNSDIVSTFFSVYCSQTKCFMAVPIFSDYDIDIVSTLTLFGDKKREQTIKL